MILTTANSEFIKILDDVGCVTLPLRGRNSAIWVLLQLALTQTFVQNVERHLAMGRLLVHPVQLLLELGNSLRLLSDLHGRQLFLFVLVLYVHLFSSSFRPSFEQERTVSLLR